MYAQPITTVQAGPEDFLGLLHRLLAGIVRSDRPFIKTMRQFIVRSRGLQAKEAKPPRQPLEDVRIAYGYLMALADIAHVAERMVVPQESITFLLRNKEARDVLLCLAKAPIGVLSQKDLTEELGRSQPNVSRAMKKLEKRGFIRQETRGGDKNPKHVVAITAEGKAASRVVEGGETANESPDQSECDFSVLIESSSSPNDLMGAVYEKAVEEDNPEKVGELLYDALDTLEMRICLPLILLALREVNSSRMENRKKIAPRLLKGMIQGGLDEMILEEHFDCAFRYSDMGVHGWSEVVSNGRSSFLQKSMDKLMEGTAT